MSNRFPGTLPCALPFARFNMLIDGQFGSTGKGLLAAYLATESPCDIYASNLSPNAGHTFPFMGEHVVTKQLPVGGILNDRALIYLTAGSIIDAQKLFEETCRFDIWPERLIIHPRAAVVEAEDIDAERQSGSSVEKIASTQSGVGAALCRKIQRSAGLAEGNALLNSIAEVRELDLMDLMDGGCTVMMETCQGFDLSLNSGLSYPHCTSREVTVNETLSAAQVHPSYLGKVAVCLRSYPIRVGNIVRDGEEVGNSGPFYPDSAELSWADLGVKEELTTVTKRVRRVATFSLEQYKRMLHHLRPDIVFFNFANYTRDEELGIFRKAFELRRPDLVSVGRSLEQIYPVFSKSEAVRLLRLASGEKDRCHAGLSSRGVFVPASH